MAATKKNTKGSKTAHVLNLLTAPDAPKEGAPAGDEAAASSAGQAAPAASSRPLLPPILEVAQSNDDNLAQQIQQALEDELAEEPVPSPAAKPSAQSVVEAVSPVTTEQVSAAPEPVPTPAAPAPSGGKMSPDQIEAMLATSGGGDDPIPEPASAPESAPAPEPAPEPAPAPKPAPAPEPAPEPAPAPESAPAPEATPEPQPEPNPAPPSEQSVSQPPEEKEEDVTYTNVMQVLVEEKAPKYIKKFGLCDCKHCAADVKALTLSNLVPKYVVLSKLDRIPMLTVYEGRYSSTIFAQLTRACKVVMDHPHHSREE